MAGLTFPTDLTSLTQRYMTFQFMAYEGGLNSVFGMATGASGGGVCLPMPDKINDNPSVVWTEDNAKEQVLGGALSTIEREVGGRGFGYTINPFLTVLFQRPNFRTFSFSWTLAPKNQSETQTLTDILNMFRKNMLPTKENSKGGIGQALLKFPNVVKIGFDQESSKHLFKFKNCAIESINYDYTSAGMPAFFKNTSGPAQVRLTINLKEIEIWTSEEVV